jgi:kinesin family protein 12
VVECSPATRAARVRFPADATFFFLFYYRNNILFIFILQVIDLLNPGSARKPLAVRWSKKARGFFVENLFTVDCEELDDLIAVLEEGLRNRAVGKHNMNEFSRSTVVTIYA